MPSELDTRKQALETVTGESMQCLQFCTLQTGIAQEWKCEIHEKMLQACLLNARRYLQMLYLIRG